MCAKIVMNTLFQLAKAKADLLSEPRFPKASAYDPFWLLENAFAANPLWLAEWVFGDLNLTKGMKVLDLGCGLAKSSVFLAREYGVRVWCVDLWSDVETIAQTIVDARSSESVIPVNADVKELPFEFESFDAILAFDSMQYFGTDCLFLPYIAQFLKPGGILGFASAGLVNEVRRVVPEHLEKVWTPDYWCLRTEEWWVEHWERTGIVDVFSSETMEGGWKLWHRWADAGDCPAWYLDALSKDAGRHLGYIKVVAKKAAGVPLLAYDLRTGEDY
jgi:SAM-dependent methyltransferase